MTLQSIQNRVRLLPAELLRDLDALHISAEEKQDFATKVWDLWGERAMDLVWSAAARDARIMDTLQAQHEIDPDIPEDQLVELIISSQPALLDELAAEIETTRTLLSHDFSL